MATPEYGSTEYGQGEYGGQPPQSKNVSSQVGTQFDLAINGVGLKLVPGKKSYDKHAAQTYSFNPKSLFKQGDGAALNASDLYYWQRLEHSKWDGGETYEPWQPDPADPRRLSHKYSKSFGFDTSDPHRLSVLREAYTSPTYDFVINTDTPIAYWKLADAPPTIVQGVGGIRPWWRSSYRSGVSVSQQVYEQEDNPKQFGTTTPSGVTLGYAPGPISFGSSDTAALFDGAAGAITSGKLDFSSNQTPPNWSLECWAKPLRTDQSAIMALIGSNITPAGGNTSYQTTILGDTPSIYYPLNDTVTTTAVDKSGNARNGTYSGTYTQNEAGYTGSASTLFGGGKVTSNANSPVNTTPFTIECWFYATSATGPHWLIASGDPGVAVSVGNCGGGTPDNNLNWQIHRNDGSNNVGQICSFPASQLNKWHHLVCNFYLNAGQLFMDTYLDGSLVGSAGNLGVFGGSFNAGTFQIGNWTFGNPGAFAGYISDAAVYPANLNLTQVNNHYNAAPGTSSTQPGGFAIGLSDGAGNVGTHFSAYLPGVGWKDSTQVMTTAWQHLAITYDGASIRFYYNGNLVATVASSYSAATAFGSIGARQSSTGVLEKFFNGALGQVATYNTTLSAARVLAHYQRGTGAISFHLLQDAGGNVGNYARFIETFNGNIYVNQKNTNVLYSTNGGDSWTNIAIPGGDGTDIVAMWSKGDKIYVATANNVYTGDQGGLATFNGGNPALAGVTAGIYYSGQIYVGIGTSLYYVDPATGIKTQLFNTNNFTITFIEAFQGKIWFGGTNNRMTRLWTWTNNTLPPSPANGVGQQVQDGTVPYGFIVRSSCVYLNLLCLGGTVAGDTTTEGQGAVYYITSSGQFGQLCVLGPQMKDIRGTGTDWGVRSLWGAENRLYMGYSFNTGIARYDFTNGSFSTHLTAPNPSFGMGQPLGLYGTGLGLPVLAVCFFNGKAMFAVGTTGDVWRESTKKVAQAQLEESEFLELPFLPKIIDGIEGSHSPLQTGQAVEVEMSFDNGLTWSSMGVNQTPGTDHFDFPLTNIQGNHWRSRVNAYRGADLTLAPEIYNWSVRFAPYNSPKHEWVIDCYLPTIQQASLGAVLTDVGAKLLTQLWSSRENGTVIDFVDADRKRYRVLVIELKQQEINQRPVRASANQLQMGATITVELLEVARVS